MTQAELDQLLEKAAERGARLALESVGLHDDAAGKDIRDLRTLIDSWRTAKRAALTTIIQWMTVGILGAIAATIYWKR
jgi:hypothetical protein